MQRQILRHDYFLLLLEFLEFMCNKLHHRACARDYARDDVIGIFLCVLGAWRGFSTLCDSVPVRHETSCSATTDTVNIIHIYCKGNYNKCVTKGILFLQATVYFAYSATVN